jgi:alpha-N-arabinofuranosidase
MTPEQYANEFCRFRTFVFSYPDAPVEAIACGPNGRDWAWTRRLLECLRSGHTGNRLGRMQGLAAHYYCGTAGTATEYTESQWLELLAKAYAIEGVITGHRAILDEYDPDRKIKLLFDEWGAWHPVEQGKPPRGLYQQSTIRDACVAALSLDVFHQHADKLFMCNIAQLINVLQALLLVDEENCIKTPTYHVFDLYRPHQGATAVRFLTAAETVSEGEGAAEFCRACYLDRRRFGLRAVHGSASVRDGLLTVTAVNTHHTEPVEVELDIHEGRLEEAEVITLTADHIRAHNTFAQPENVKLSAPAGVTAPSGGPLRVSLPAASVIRVQGRLR